MKKGLSMLMAVVMAGGLTACGGSSTTTTTAAPAGTTAAAAGTTAAAAEASSVSASLTVGTGGETGTYYGFTNILSTVIGQKSKISLDVVSSGGSKANLLGIADGTYQAATVQSDVMAYAYQGVNSFADSGAITNFRVLAGLYAETVQIVTLDPNIKTVADLKGKSVCVGDVGSGTYYNAVDVLKAYDMTIDDIDPKYQSFGDSTESLKDGKIDAAFLTAGAPTTAVVDLAASKTVYMVSIEDANMEKLLAECPYYAAYTLPEGTYGITAPAQTVTVKATLVCDEKVDDDVAYEIVKIIFENKDEIAAQHAKGEELDLTFATEGIAVPFAAGAAKYYQEKGLTVSTK